VTLPRSPNCAAVSSGWTAGGDDSGSRTGSPRRCRRGSTAGFFAATADAMGLTLVTRNEKDLDGRGVRILNPWTP